MRTTTRTLAVLVIGAYLVSVPASHAGPKAFLEALDKAMKDYATDLQAEGESNLATIKTIGGKLLHPTKWKELGQDVDAGFKNYSGALIKTGDNALANTKAMVKVLLSVRTYIPDFILKWWDAAVARFKAAADAAGGGGGGGGQADAAWSGDVAAPAGDGDGALEADVPEGAPSAPSSEDAGTLGAPQIPGAMASGTRKPKRTLSDYDRDRLLSNWVDMRASATALVKLSAKAKPEGKAKVAAAMESTVATVAAHDRKLLRHLAVNPKACVAFAKSLERANREDLAAMSDVISQLHRVYVSKARDRKASGDVKAAVEALAKLKQKKA